MPARFTDKEICRAVDAARSCGLAVTGVVVSKSPDGAVSIDVRTEDAVMPSGKGKGPKQWGDAA